MSVGVIPEAAQPLSGTAIETACMEKRYHVYILATRKGGPIYVGVTSDLAHRIYQHKTHEIKGHTARYNIDRLVYFESFDEPGAAIAREKRLKKWRREWKDALIAQKNPEWNDLYEDLQNLL